MTSARNFVDTVEEVSKTPAGRRVSKNFDEPSSLHTVLPHMKTRALPLVVGSLVLLGSAHAGLFPRGIVDHSLCCGTGPMASVAARSDSVSGVVGGGGGLAVVADAPVAVAPAVLSPAELEKKLANPEVDAGHLKLGFDRLAGFKFVPPQFDPSADPKATPPSGEEQIPAIVKAWSGKKAMVTGFMQPTKLEKGKCTEFILMANQAACCFGAVPNLNEWIVVRSPKGVPVIMDVPISFYGTLKVGATFENGYLTGIYQLEADKMAEIKE